MAEISKKKKKLQFSSVNNCFINAILKFLNWFIPLVSISCFSFFDILGCAAGLLKKNIYQINENTNVRAAGM